MKKKSTGKKNAWEKAPDRDASARAEAAGGPASAASADRGTAPADRETAPVHPAAGAADEVDAALLAAAAEDLFEDLLEDDFSADGTASGATGAAKETRGEAGGGCSAEPVAGAATLSEGAGEEAPVAALPYETFTVPPKLAGVRADKILATACPEFSRERLQGLFEAGKVFVGNAQARPIAKKTRLNEGDVLVFEQPQALATSVHPVPMALEILYEDDALVAVNKPVGLVVHPGAGVADQATLVHGMLAHCNGHLAGAGGDQRPGIVHRLDRDTSGIIVLAKTDAAYYQLVKAFAERQTRKIYWALVRRGPREDSGTIKLPIGRHPVQRHKMAVREDGRYAHTDWHVLERFSGGHALVQCRIHTGRTHQIRVHLSQLGCPIWGDATYGYRPLQRGEKAPSQFLLHARELELPHPLSGKSLLLRAEPSAHFAEHLEWLRLQKS